MTKVKLTLGGWMVVSMRVDKCVARTCVRCIRVCVDAVVTFARGWETSRMRVLRREWEIVKDRETRTGEWLVRPGGMWNPRQPERLWESSSGPTSRDSRREQSSGQRARLGEIESLALRSLLFIPISINRPNEIHGPPRGDTILSWYYFRGLPPAPSAASSSSSSTRARLSSSSVDDFDDCSKSRPVTMHAPTFRHRYWQWETRLDTIREIRSNCSTSPENLAL